MSRKRSKRLETLSGSEKKKGNSSRPNINKRSKKWITNRTGLSTLIFPKQRKIERIRRVSWLHHVIFGIGPMPARLIPLMDLSSPPSTTLYVRTKRLSKSANLKKTLGKSEFWRSNGSRVTFAIVLQRPWMTKTFTKRLKRISRQSSNPRKRLMKNCKRKSSWES